MPLRTLPTTGCGKDGNETSASVKSENVLNSSRLASQEVLCSIDLGIETSKYACCMMAVAPD
jgi:hypothetical protein